MIMVSQRFKISQYFIYRLVDQFKNSLISKLQMTMWLRIHKQNRYSKTSKVRKISAYLFVLAQSSTDGIVINIANPSQNNNNGASNINKGRHSNQNVNGSRGNGQSITHKGLCQKCSSEKQNNKPDRRESSPF